MAPAESEGIENVVNKVELGQQPPEEELFTFEGSCREDSGPPFQNEFLFIII